MAVGKSSRLRRAAHSNIPQVLIYGMLRRSASFHAYTMSGGTRIASCIGHGLRDNHVVIQGGERLDITDEDQRVQRCRIGDKAHLEAKAFMGTLVV